MALITRQRRIDSSIDLTPLIDVVFQLLIFLMVSSQFTKPESVVNLPQAQSEAGLADPSRDRMAFAIEADGSVLLDNVKIAREDLDALVQKRVAQDGVKRVEIRGDESSKHGVFMEVLETARRHGIESLGIIMKKAGTDD
ncbi:biopolymer transporter ExbD [Verrucomicrobiales bacterium]|nr:biopolymer transporter ExbD [Verrucomicrobiales bacterium]